MLSPSSADSRLRRPSARAWRGISSHPVAAVAAGVALALAVGMPGLRIAGFAGLGNAVIVVGCLALAEHVMGGFRAVIALLVAPMIAIPAAAALDALQTGTGFETALRTSAELTLDPLVIGGGCLLATSAYLSPRWRRRMRVGIIAGLAALALFNGSAVDIARFCSGAIGLAIGLAVGPRVQVRSASGLHSALAAALVALAAGPVILAASHSAHGPLEPLADSRGGFITLLVIPGMLVVTAAMLRARGGRVPVILGGVALLGLGVTAFASNVVVPLTQNWIEWTGISAAEATWQIEMLGSWAIPLGMLVALVIVEARSRRIVATTGGSSPVEREVIGRLVAATDAGTLGHMATWKGNRYWRSAATTGAIAYRRIGRVALALSDPIASGADSATVMREFERYCDNRDLIPVFYGLHAQHVSGLRHRGWHAVAVADESMIDLESFTLSGKRRNDLRTASNRAERIGLSAVWTTFPDADDGLRNQIRRLSRESAGRRRLPKLEFTVGALDELRDPEVQLVVARDEAGRVHAVTSWLPIWEEHRLIGRTLDVMWRQADAMPGAMEFLIAAAALGFRAGGLQKLSLSATPLIVDAAPGRRARLTAWLLGVIAQGLEGAYGFRSLARFKRKLHTSTQPLYVAYPDALALPMIAAAVLRAHLPSRPERTTWG